MSNHTLFHFWDCSKTRMPTDKGGFIAWNIAEECPGGPPCQKVRFLAGSFDLTRHFNQHIIAGEKPERVHVQVFDFFFCSELWLWPNHISVCRTAYTMLGNFSLQRLTKKRSLTCTTAKSAKFWLSTLSRKSCPVASSC